MNGVHDMGGMHGLGPIEWEPDEPVFHEQWEGRIEALNRMLLAGFHYNLDEFRHARERMEPSHYLRASYYERSVEGIAMLLLEKGVISREEFETRLNDLAERKG